VLIGFAGLNVLLAERTSAYALGHVGLYTPVIVLLYLVAMRAIFVYERTQLEEFAEQMADRHPEITLRTAITRYAIAAVVVVGAGAFLPFIAAHLAQIMGWKNTFVGTLFVAGVTSLPELVVTIAALRIGALDMAIANLLGSNLFNIAILTLEDLLFVKGPLLAHVSLAHAMSAMSAVVMTGVIIIGLVYRPKTRLFMGVGWISLSLLTFYLLNSFVIYLHGE
jgi:cation:H+ antiporter